MSEALRWIGARVPKLDAKVKASGEVRYLPDFVMGGMLHGAIRRSDRVHAKVKRIDVSLAKQVPGVHVVLTAKDIDDLPTLDRRPVASRKLDTFPTSAREYIDRFGG